MAVRKPPAERPGTPLSNRNFLSPTGFKFSLKRSPAAAFFCNQANIPSMDLGVATQPSYLRDIPTPGDKIDFGDLSIRFLVDEDLVNYMELQRWIRGLGFPDSMKDFKDLEKEAVIQPKFANKGDNIYSDGTLQILSSNLVAKFNVNFKDLFPVSLSTITFDATDTDIEYFTAEATFKYTIYNLTDLENKDL
tara:strand:+ start:1585 stop:2160 length:576 start_codon:yes stop_codon:yes gene_type:complete